MSCSWSADSPNPGNGPQALIMAGNVFTPTGRVAKPGSLLASDVEVEVRGLLPYVSRGGTKLAHALDEFGVDPSGLVALDVGASTGGFTDCLLQRGASRVYAVDVGHGQLAYTLRQDPRVVSFEKLNAPSPLPAAGGGGPAGDRRILSSR